MQWKGEALELWERIESRWYVSCCLNRVAHIGLTRKGQLGKNFNINNPQTSRRPGESFWDWLGSEILAWKVCLSHDCACEIPQGGSRSYSDRSLEEFGQWKACASKLQRRSQGTCFGPECLSWHLSLFLFTCLLGLVSWLFVTTVTIVSHIETDALSRLQSLS